MSYQSLYNKYRPKIFNDLYGQDVIKQILSNSIKQNKTHHAYIFSGPRGTGKTSCARIFSKALNCEKFIDDVCNQCSNCELINSKKSLDILEIDAASNNGVESIRELVNNAYYLPVDLKKKIYIIDEAHMLTTSSWNALLKIVEEPPAHLTFIFSTTEPQKIIPTIQSRCIKHNFVLLNQNLLADIVVDICQKEKIEIERNAAEKIAKLGYGSVRDSLSLLEQTIFYAKNKIDLTTVEKALFLVDENNKIEFLKHLFSQDQKAFLESLEKIYYEGYQLNSFINELIEIVLDLVVFQKTYSLNLLKVLDEKQLAILGDYKVNYQQYLNNFFDIQKNLLEHKNVYNVVRLKLLNLFNQPSNTIVEKQLIQKPNVSEQLLEKTVINKPDINSKIVVDQRPEVEIKPKSVSENYEHKASMFVTKTVEISNYKLSEYLNLNTSQNTTTKIEDNSKVEQKDHSPTNNNESNFLKYSKEHLIKYVLANRDRKYGEPLIAKIKELLSQNQPANKVLYESFANIDKNYLLSSDKVILVFFQDELSSEEFNTFLESPTFFTNLNNFFETNFYWVGCYAKQLPELIKKFKDQKVEVEPIYLEKKVPLHEKIKELVKK